MMMTETMKQPFRLLLATDGSEAAVNAEAWAARLRWDHPCEIDILCVAGYGITRLGWSMQGDRSSARAISEQIREAEVIAAERTANETSLRLQEAGFATRVLARHGDVADEIIATIESERPDLVALGPRGRSRIAQVLLGSVTQQVIDGTRRPLLVARKPPTDAGGLPRSILVLLDGTEAGHRAIEWLLATGWARGADVTLLGLLGVPSGLENDYPETMVQVATIARQEASVALEGFAQQLAEQGCDMRLEMDSEHPVDATLRLADCIGPDVIVVPRHHKRRGRDPFAEKIARYSDTTVLVISEP